MCEKYINPHLKWGLTFVFMRNIGRRVTLTNNEFLEKLNREFGILPPDKYDQDWEFTAGDSSKTEEYIEFYDNENLSVNQKDIIMNMIIQGLDGI